MKASALQMSVDRLTLTLGKAEESESSLKDKVQSLSAALTESSAGADSAEEKVLQLQKALTASEHDRRVLQVGAGHVGRGGSPLGSCSRGFTARTQVTLAEVLGEGAWDAPSLDWDAQKELNWLDRIGRSCGGHFLLCTGL